MVTFLNTLGGQMQIAQMVLAQGSVISDGITECQNAFSSKLCPGKPDIMDDLASNDPSGADHARSWFTENLRLQFDARLRSMSKEVISGRTKRFFSEGIDNVRLDVLARAGLVTATVASEYLNSVLEAASIKNTRSLALPIVGEIIGIAGVLGAYYIMERSLQALVTMGLGTALAGLGVFGIASVISEDTNNEKERAIIAILSNYHIKDEGRVFIE